MFRLASLFFIMTPAVWCANLFFLTGSEIDTKSQSYTYFGLVGEKALGSRDALRGRIWADYLTYKFYSGNEKVKAEAPAFHLAVGYRRSFGSAVLGGWVGWEQRNTDLSPDVRDVQVRGVQNSLLLQVDLFGKVNDKTETSFIVSFSTATSYLWARGRIHRIFGSGLYGLELIGQGNEDYRAVQSGIYGGYRLGSVNFILKGGYKDSSSGDGLYGGAELFVAF